MEKGGTALISVIMVTFQSMQVLSWCLESLEKCSSSNELEIWMVDNHSQDGTWEWLERYTKGKYNKPFADIHLLRLNDNMGYAYANNIALKRARGDYFLLLNPDTLVSENAIQVCVEKIKSDPSIGAITCRLQLGNGEMDNACHRSFPTLWNSFSYFSGLSKAFPQSSTFSGYQLTYLEKSGSYPVDAISGAFLMLTKVVYDTIGGLDEDYFMYGEDIDYCYQLKRKGFLVWYEGSVTTIHFKGGNGGKKSKASLKHFYESMIIFLQKNYKEYYPIWLIQLMTIIIKFIYFIKLNE